MTMPYKQHGNKFPLNAMLEPMTTLFDCLFVKHNKDSTYTWNFNLLFLTIL